MKKSRLVLMVLSLLFIFTFCISGFASAQEINKIKEILKRGYLKVGTGSTVPGYCQRTPDGKIEGIDIDISKMLAKVLFGDENKVKFTAVTGAGRIPAVVTRKVDVVICCMTIVPQRAIKAAFTIPYVKSGQILLLRRDAKAEKLEDLNKEGIKITFFGAPFYAKIAKKYFPKATPLPFESPGEALLAVRSGRAHAMIHEMGPAKNIAKDAKSLMVFDKLVSSPMNVGMLVNKQDLQWLNFLNTFIQEITEGFYSDVYKKMYMKWFGEEPPSK